MGWNALTRKHLFYLAHGVFLISSSPLLLGTQKQPIGLVVEDLVELVAIKHLKTQLGEVLSKLYLLMLISPRCFASSFGFRSIIVEPDRSYSSLG